MIHTFPVPKARARQKPGEPEVPRAMPGQRESLHKAMAAILEHRTWWAFAESKAVGIAMMATKGALSPDVIRSEFRAMRQDRGLPPVYPMDGA